MLRPVIVLVVGTALLLGCTSGEEAAESEASAEEGIDTAAMIAEGATSGQRELAEDPNLVPVEVSYNARLVHPQTEAFPVTLPKGGQYTASGKGICRVDERAGTWDVALADIDQGNLQSFKTMRWKPEDAPYFTNFLSAGKGDLEIFTATNDGKDFLDKAVITAKRTGDGGRVQFAIETTSHAYSLQGTVTCARLSPPIQ